MPMISYAIVPEVFGGSDYCTGAELATEPTGTFAAADLLISAIILLGGTEGRLELFSYFSI